MDTTEEGALRDKIGQMLASGLVTTIEPIPQNSEQLRGILNELRELGPDELEQKLVVAGFADRPYGSDNQRCLECMYYHTHRKWCAFPPLALPVEPEWWCRLWRV